MPDQGTIPVSKGITPGVDPSLDHIQPEVVGDFELPKPELLTNEKLLLFNQHILLTVQAVQQLNTALKTTRFL